MLETQKLHNVNNNIQNLQFKLTNNSFGKEFIETPNCTIAVSCWVKPRRIGDLNEIYKCLMEDFKIGYKPNLFFDVWNILSIYYYSRLPPFTYYINCKCIYALNKNLFSKDFCSEIDKYLND